jgi:thiol-disulfide isomerase/thioredoxin
MFNLSQSLTNSISLSICTDFWTTKCTRCPEALDKLDGMAQDPKYKDVQFISICCDKLDGARDIIEMQDDLRWQNINHYFMDKEDKELAKKILGFQQVPFYVILDDNGSIQQSGTGKQVDFEEIPGIVRSEEEPVVAAVSSSIEMEESKIDETGDFGLESAFELDFTNQLSLHNDTCLTLQSVVVPVIDQNLFDMEDF